MRDYKELVERLRADTYTFEELSIILPQAADAIEELLGDNAVLNGTVLNGTVANLLEQLAYIGITPKWISVEDENGQV